MIAHQEPMILPIPGAPNYGMAPDRTVFSKKRRGRPSSRIARNPDWAPIKTHPGPRDGMAFVVLWDGEKTIRRPVAELFSKTYADTPA